MAVAKRKNAYKTVIIWLIILLLLSAAAVVGYVYVSRYLSERQAEELQRVEDTNETLTQAYNERVAQRNSLAAAVKTDTTMPMPAESGWDVVDMSAYPVSTGSTIYASRRDMLAGGLLLINRWHMMPSDLLDEYMIGINQYSRASEDKNAKIPTENVQVALQQTAADALMRLYSAARASGLDMDHIIVQYGFRDMAAQTEAWNKQVEALSSRYTGDTLTEKARETVSYPGTSDYQTGLSFFVYNYKSGDKDFTNTPLHQTEQGQWLYDHGWEYGFVFRFPVQGFPYDNTVDKSYKTGIGLKLKTYRYVGEANAAAMHTLNMCLEEYIEYLAAHPHLAVYEDGELRYEIYRTPGGNSDAIVNIPAGAESWSVSTDNMDGLVVTASF